MASTLPNFSNPFFIKFSTSINLEASSETDSKFVSGFLLWYPTKILFESSFERSLSSWDPMPPAPPIIRIFI